MARYNRDFLVPYLRDVYYIECVGNRLNNEISEVENDIKRNNYELNHITPPQKPQMGNKASYSEDGGIMVVVVAIIALVINGVQTNTCVIIAAYLYAFLYLNPFPSTNGFKQA